MNFFSILAGRSLEKPKEKAPVKGVPNSESDIFLANLSNQPIIALLKSEVESDQLKGMKILIAMQIRRKDVTAFVPYVVNIITTSFYVKRLTYYFLCTCSGEASNQILMSINSFHKELKDGKIIVRGSALRAFSSLRIDEILNIMTMALQRGVSDFSVYVRRSACYALIKLSEWEDCDRGLMLQMLNKLLTDSEIFIVGPALVAFNCICPEKLDLLHGHFRRIVRNLPSIEFLFIPNTLLVLKRYARIYLDLQFVEKTQRVNNDFKVLMDSVEELLHYDSPSVIVAAAEFFLFFSQTKYYQKAVFALLNFKHIQNHLAFLKLSLLYEFSIKDPSLFSSVYSYFFIHSSDSYEMVMKKLDILAVITTENNASSILKELLVYTKHEKPEIAIMAVSIFGKICERQESLYNPCTKHLVSLLKSRSPYIASQVIVVMRKLISQNPEKNRKIIVHCAKNIESIVYPNARACALWIIGKYFKVIPTLAVETMRKISIGFVRENNLVKHQLINSVSKVYAETGDQNLFRVLRYLLELGFYDISYDIRDKTRLVSGLFIEKCVDADAKKLFEEFNDEAKVILKTDDFVPMSLSYLLGSRVKGYERYYEDLLDVETLKKTLMEDTSNLRDEEVTPTVTLKSSQSYSSEGIQNNVSGSGLRTRVVVNDPTNFQEFLKEESEEEEYEEYSEEEEENSED